MNNYILDTIRARPNKFWGQYVLLWQLGFTSLFELSFLLFIEEFAQHNDLLIEAFTSLMFVIYSTI